jgi:hypothetical protein
MKTIFDSSFKYRPSFDTDVRKTFCRIRREQQVHVRPAPPAARASTRRPSGLLWKP